MPTRIGVLYIAILLTATAYGCAPATSPRSTDGAQNASPTRDATEGIAAQTHPGPDFWTVVAASIETSRTDARQVAVAAVGRLRGSGIDAEWAASDNWDVLKPGLLIVYAGEYPGRQRAQRVLSAVRAAGFPQATVRHLFNPPTLAPGEQTPQAPTTPVPASPGVGGSY